MWTISCYPDSFRFQKHLLALHGNLVGPTHSFATLNRIAADPVAAAQIFHSVHKGHYRMGTKPFRSLKNLDIFLYVFEKTTLAFSVGITPAMVVFQTTTCKDLR